MASTPLFPHPRPSPSSSIKPLPKTQVCTENLITHYCCGHSHSTTTPESVQTQNVNRLSTGKKQNQATTKSDPSSCLQCKKDLTSELRQAPPTRGVQETIDAVLNLGDEGIVARLQNLQENVLGGESPSFSIKGKLPNEDDENEMNRGERQQVLSMVAQEKLDVVARVVGSDSVSGEESVMNERSGDVMKSIHTRSSWGLETWRLASIDEVEEPMQTSSSHKEDRNSLTSERLSIDFSVRHIADDSSPQLETYLPAHDPRVSDFTQLAIHPSTGHQPPRRQSQDQDPSADRPLSRHLPS